MFDGDSNLIWEAYNLSKHLLESVSSHAILYHASQIKNINDIIRSNEFNLNLSKNEMAKMTKYQIYDYFMSTARTTTSNYIKELIDYTSTPAIIELDESKIKNDGYKIVPFNWNRYDTDKTRNVSSESEERILSQSSTIPNFLKYVVAFHIYNYFNFNIRSDTTSQIYTSTVNGINNLIDTGIPVYMYNNENDLKVLNKTKRKLLQTHIF